MMRDVVAGTEVAEAAAGRAAAISSEGAAANLGAGVSGAGEAGALTTTVADRLEVRVRVAEEELQRLQTVHRLASEERDRLEEHLDAHGGGAWAEERLAEANERATEAGDDVDEARAHVRRLQARRRAAAPKRKGEGGPGQDGVSPVPSEGEGTAEGLRA